MKPIIEWLSINWGIDTNTSSTILISLIVFLLGILLNILYRIITNYLQRKSYRKLFKFTLSEIAKSSIKQSRNFLDFSEYLVIEKDEAIPLSRQVNTYIITIQKFDFKEIFESFTKGLENLFYKEKNTKYLNSSYKYVGLITENENHYFGEFSNMIEKLSFYKSKWDDALKKITRLNNSSFLEVQSKLEKSIEKDHLDYLKGIYNILAEWKNLDNETRTKKKIVMSSLITPLSNHINNNINKPYVNIDYFEYLNEASLAYKNIENVLFAYKNTFKNMSFIYRKSSKILKHIHSKI